MQNLITQRIKNLDNCDLIRLFSLFEHRTMILHPGEPAVFYISYILREQLRKRELIFFNEELTYKIAADTIHQGKDVYNYLGMKNWNELIEYYDNYCSRIN